MNRVAPPLNQLHYLQIHIKTITAILWTVMLAVIFWGVSPNGLMEFFLYTRVFLNYWKQVVRTAYSGICSLIFDERVQFITRKTCRNPDGEIAFWNNNIYLVLIIYFCITLLHEHRFQSTSLLFLPPGCDHWNLAGSFLFAREIVGLLS